MPRGDHAPDANYCAGSARTVPTVSAARDSGSIAPSIICSSSRVSVSFSRSAAASAVERDAVLDEQALRLLERAVGEPGLLGVAHALRLLGEGVVVRAHRARRGHLGHAVLEHHRARDLGHLLEVVRGAVRDPAEDDLLGGAARERDLHHVEELLLRVQVALLHRQVVRVAERLAAGDDRHLLDRQQVAHQVRHQRVAGLVVGEDALLLLGHDAPLLQAGEHALHRRPRTAPCRSCSARGGRRRWPPRCRCWRGRRR